MQLELKKQKKKAALMQAAYELFLKKGVPLTSVGEITARASVAKGTFYLYFRDKEDILGAVSAAALRQLLEEGYMRMSAARTGSFTENLLTLSDAVAGMLLQNRPLFELIRRGGRLPKPEKGSALWGSLLRDLRQSPGGELAGKSDIKSIAFCCISTGEFHFPNGKAAEIAIETVREWQRKNPGRVEVIFNVFKDCDYEIYKKLLG